MATHCTQSNVIIVGVVLRATHCNHQKQELQCLFRREPDSYAAKQIEAGEVASSKTQLFNWRPFRTFPLSKKSIQ